MKYLLKTSLVVVSSFAITVLTGCLGGGSAPPPQIPSTQITTQATQNGLLKAWAGAQLYGGASSGTYNCGGPTVDPNCVVNFGPVFTDSNGSYILSSNALGNVQWTFAASDAQNSNTCPNGASDTVTPSVGGITQLFCDQNNAFAVTASPASCITTTNTSSGDITTNCPATISLTATQSIFPTSYAIQASSYTEAGALVVSNNITATSSTTITVPTPTTSGWSAVVFIDPTTNLVVGAASFDSIQRTTSINCGPGGDKCP